MKKGILYFLTVLTLLPMSCKENLEVSDQQLKLAKITYSNTVKEETILTSTFTYTHDGILDKYIQTDQADEAQRIVEHFYDEQKKLASIECAFLGFNDNSSNSPAYTTSIFKHVFSYTPSGILSKIEEYSREQSLENWHTTPYQDSLLMNDRGQIDEVKVKYSNGDYNTYVFEYDESGNIIKQTQYLPSQTSGMISSSITLEITYDNKRNPFYRLGSPSFSYNVSNLQLSPWVLYSSPNNPVKITLQHKGANTQKREYQMAYEYNEQGYPIKRNDGDYIQKINYSFD